MPKKLPLPALAAKKVGQLERVMLSLIDLRITCNDNEFNGAVANQRWSQVAGLHGVGTGLVLARKLIVEEFESLRSKHANEKKSSTKRTSR